MDLALDGRRAIVTGGTRGLGLACAQALVAEGCRVAVVGSTARSAERAAADLGRDSVALSADLSDPAASAALVDQGAILLGGVDILIINGPPPATGDFAATSAAGLLDAFAAHPVGAAAMCHAVLPDMRAQRWGRIIAITSVSASRPLAWMMVSNSVRPAVTGMLRALAQEVAEAGITVNCVEPGLHETQRVLEVYGEDLERAAAAIPVGRIGDPAGLGALVAFLCSPHADYITGASVPVDGGLASAFV